MVQLKLVRALTLFISHGDALDMRTNNHLTLTLMAGSFTRDKSNQVVATLQEKVEEEKEQ